MADPKINDPNIKIENVVASTALTKKKMDENGNVLKDENGDPIYTQAEVDLESVAVALSNVEYEPEQFPGLVFHLDKPKTAALIFGSGKIVCTGAKSIDEVKEAINITVDKIRNAGTDIPEDPVVVVQNIVASANLHAELNLDAIAIGLDGTEYEPEQFPGLVYRMTDPKVVLLLFGSGKIVCTGAKKPSDVGRAVENVSKKLGELGLL
ncbi:MAG: TATA-box-binding protein [Candidatus Hydrothermarchaeales archaeon]